MILQNIMLEPDGADLHLRATDLTIEISTACELLEESRAEAFTLSGRDLFEIVKKLPESAEIAISSAPGGQVTIVSGRSRFRLSVLDAKGFPSIAEHVKGKPFPIDMGKLIDASSRVLYAVREDMKDRIYLTGVCLHPEDKGNKIVVAGCDGHNLAVVRFAAEAETFPLAIVPVKTIKAIKKLFGEGKASAAMTVSEILLQVECGGVKLISKLIDATYPDYMRVRPQLPSQQILTPVDRLSSAVARVCLVANDLDKETVGFNLGKGLLTVSLTASDAEAATEDFPVDYDGDELTVGFNGRYLQQLFGSIRTQDVIINLWDALTPGVFLPTIGDEFFLVMSKRF